jgi:hypothetical protein
LNCVEDIPYRIKIISDVAMNGNLRDRIINATFLIIILTLCLIHDINH